MAYVDRYAGILEDATRECDTALKLDPGNYMFRSCAWAFMYLGKTQQAWKYAKLDAGSEWTDWATPWILLREGKINEAREAVKKVPATPTYRRDLLEAVVGLRSPSELDRIAALEGASDSKNRDPESLYQQGSLLAFAGKSKPALKLVRSAIEGNFCAYTALEQDPLLDKIRSAPEFRELLMAARHCQEAILAQKSSNPN